MKPFTRSSKAGFTLVELIIVIAILAILAGVAIPVYSGYIKKANQAADLQLLAAVNTSFAAACTEVGIGSTDVTGAVLKVTGGCITGVSVSGIKESAAPLANRPGYGVGYAVLSAARLDASDAKARISAGFLTYFGDNKSVRMKYYDGAGNFAFNPATGCFEAYENGASIEYSYVDSNGVSHTLTVNTNDLNKYSGSTFDALGTRTLTNTINDLAEHVATNFTDLLTGENPNPDFIIFLNTLDLGDKTLESLTPQERANAIALWVASESKGFEPKTIASQMANGEQPTITGESSAVAALAMEYAMLLAYSNTDAAANNPYIIPDTEDSFTGTGTKRNEWYNSLVEKYGAENVEIVSGDTNPGRTQGTISVKIKGSETSISDLFDSTSGDNLNPVDLVSVYTKVASTGGFQTYMAGQGANDLEGYLAAMNMINTNVSNIDVSELLSSGYLNDDFNAMLASILG